MNVTPASPPSSHVTPSNVLLSMEVFLLVGTVIIGVSGNGCMLHYNFFVRRYSRGRPPVETMVLSSAFVDFINCLFYVPFLVHSIIWRRWDFGHSTCFGHFFLGITCQLITSCSHLVMAIFCLIWCRIPQATQENLNPWIIRATICTLYVTVTTLNLLPFLDGTLEVKFDEDILSMCIINFRNVDEGKRWLFGNVLLLNFFPILTAAVIYVKIHKQSIRHQTMTAGSRKKSKTVKVATAIFSFWVISFAPNLMVKVVHITYPLPPELLRFVTYNMFLYPAYNFIYYIFRFHSVLPQWLRKARVHPTNTISQRSGAMVAAVDVNLPPRSVRLGGPTEGVNSQQQDALDVTQSKSYPRTDLSP